MNLDNCFEIFSPSIINSCIFLLSIYSNRSQILNKLLTSPQEPLLMYKNFTNCLFDCNSKPSAILSGIDNTAL